MTINSFLNSTNPCPELLDNLLDVNHQDYSLFKEIKDLMGRDWEVMLSFVNWTSNGAADFLAKLGLDALHGFHPADKPPHDLQRIILSDCNGCDKPIVLS